MSLYAPVTPLIREAAVDHYKTVMSRLKNPHSAELQERTIDEIRRGKWDNDATTQILAKLALGTYEAPKEVDADTLVVRAVLHAYQRSLTPPDSGWGNMSYIKGSYDNTDGFKAALAAYKQIKKNHD